MKDKSPDGGEAACLSGFKPSFQGSWDRTTPSISIALDKEEGPRWDSLDDGLADGINTALLSTSNVVSFLLLRTTVDLTMFWRFGSLF